jgi:hypothetical protein
MSKKAQIDKNKNILENISPSEALEIVRQLCKEDELIKEKIIKIALKLMSNVSQEEIANEVYYALNSIDVQDLWDRSGKTRYGYVDPVDEAFNLFEEEIEPFILEMRRYQEMNFEKNAKQYCIGIIEGIRKYDTESNSDFKDWAVDIPLEYLSTVVDEWKRGNPDSKDIDEIEKLMLQE